MEVSSTRLKHALGLHHVAYSMIHHAPACSSQMAAALMHVPGREMAKAVVLQGKQRNYLAVLPASYHVDLGRFAAIVGETVHLAPEERIRELFPDCDLGALPPLGALYGLPVYVDLALTLDREIVFPAGTQCDAVRMSYGDFEALAQPEVCLFAVKSGAGHSKGKRPRREDA